ncbi:PEP-CTERM sorting domain-containing protein [Glacieibacterium frigidum]|uniref:PEP-CTERM sorting domain-containing protein n=1 Tax=Glacieibacterium frigidum TaxID=2593303 RepID=A0A552U927_9SPHN|nr:PQQ-dependent sugar dehydrogenase [Glacieibacterium frigidum]TRW14713.1 PEP-CTERM sorting domain-containing protein [Glacieibacterium frigidum]
MRRILATFAAATFLTAPALAALGTTQVASGLSAPIYLTGRGNALIVAEQGGRIVSIDRTSGVQSTFFTVPDIETGGEKGLLGLAFDPSYATNGRFYVDVTTRVSGQLVSEVRRYTNPAIANEAPSVVIRVAKPFDNHNGGWIDFGADGNLYVALGDGGAANDPFNNAQNLASSLGKILRLDVSGDAFPADDARNYAIPADNPFGTEVFVYGLRNPYRSSFDRSTGDLWIGDVGQSQREEVNFVAAGTSGQNFGWRPLEGTIPTPGVGDPIPANAVAPLFEYDHSIGQSITGGYVFGGSGVADLEGSYVFGDFVSGRLFGIDTDGGDFTDLTFALGGTSINVSSFGEDADRNLYVLDYGGRIFRFIDPSAAVVPEPASWALMITGFGLVGASLRRVRRASTV